MQIICYSFIDKRHVKINSQFLKVIDVESPIVICFGQSVYEGTFLKLIKSITYFFIFFAFLQIQSWQTFQFDKKWILRLATKLVIITWNIALSSSNLSKILILYVAWEIVYLILHCLRSKVHCRTKSSSWCPYSASSSLVGLMTSMRSL